MKHYIKHLLLLGICIPAYADSLSSLDTEVTSRSFLAVEPNFHSCSPELVSAFRSNRTHMLEDGWHGALQIAIFGGRSRKSEDLARYFLPNGHTSLIVGEKTALPNTTNFPNILASNLGIFTVGDTLVNSISIRPKQSVIGGAIHYRQSFWRNDEKCRGWWFDVLLPISRVKNSVNLTETVINTANNATPLTITGLTTYGTVIAALDQPAFKYGKISDCSDKMHRTGVSDMEFKIGYEWLDCEPCHIESYIGFVAPTSRGDDAEYLFEAVNGFYKHWGVIWGGSAGIEIWSKSENDQCLRIETTSNSRYLFKKDQLRTLDLKNKPWSRYLAVYENQAQALQAQSLITTNPSLAANLSTPGVNVFTRSVEVTPGFAYDQNTALVYKRNKFEGEVGYNFFARRSERLALRCSESNPANLPAIKANIGDGFTDPIRNISGNIFLNVAILNVAPPVSTVVAVLPVPLANYATSAITDDQLDLASGATPNTLEHNIYAAAGYNHEYREHPLAGSIGGSFTFSKSNNAVVERWTVWGKFIVSF
jgi:hypothetical protein